ncbi:phage tail tape measure C-terminal domain-containing protein [Rhodobacter capsulatus]|uniref:phage tail tape measure C-terminal domain-containing protein n=1 Tax=Rhodobacter capsulatus TaxID=1061 RepID=UPI0003D2F87E|nr:phage tail tape measure C-terminal domain-containing protein [Rhodobacter capsulatus]ETD90914.1 hypothetical protein U713_04235 [Rhodobacter capsulatus YW2]
MSSRTERRVSVRLVATGGQALKAELVGIGQEGARALTLIEAAGPRAAAGLNAAGVSAGEAMRQMQDLADRAARAATALRQAGAVSGSVMNRVNRSTGVSGGMTRDAADVAAYGRALDDLRAKHNPLFAVVRDYRATLTEIRQAHRVGAISAEEMTAAIGRERQATLASIAAIKGRTTALGGMSTATRNASHRMANLSFQLQDIGVSLAGGMNPFMVMAQQGSQISQIYGFGNGGVGALFRDLGGMARTLGQGILQVAGRFPLVTAAVALGSAAIAGMRNEINETTGAQVSFTDVARAAWQVFAENVYQIGKPVFDTIRGWWDNAVAWADWAWERIVDGVIWMGDLVINAFKVAAAGATYAFQGVPDAVGALAVGAANAVIDAVNWMIEKALAGINALAEAANAALEAVGLDPALSTLDPATFRIDSVANPYAARDAERRAALAAQIRGIVSGSPLSEYFNDVRDRALQISITPDAPAEGGAGGGGGPLQTAEEVAAAADVAATGWAAVSEALSTYASEAANWGGSVGEAITSAFRAGEEAVAEFVRTGKLDFSSLATSIIADLAKIAFRRFVFGPLASALGGVLGGIGGGIGGGSVSAGVYHSGGRVPGPASMMIPAAALAAAPRFHNGGGMGLGSDEYAAVLLRGERVLNRAETRAWEGGAGTTVNIYARDAESFRASRAQVAYDIARAVAYGRRSS